MLSFSHAFRDCHLRLLVCVYATYALLFTTSAFQSLCAKKCNFVVMVPSFRCNFLLFIFFFASLYIFFLCHLFVYLFLSSSFDQCYRAIRVHCNILSLSNVEYNLFKRTDEKWPKIWLSDIDIHLIINYKFLQDNSKTIFTHYCSKRWKKYAKHG